LARIGEDYRHRKRRLNPANPGIHDHTKYLEYDPLCLDDLAMNVPCTALGCIELLDQTGVDLKGKHVVGWRRGGWFGWFGWFLLCFDGLLTILR
jgi:hypothetical protein